MHRWMSRYMAVSVRRLIDMGMVDSWVGGWMD